jgi:hypothetical protein
VSELQPIEKAPVRRFHLTLYLGADDMETVRRALRQLAFDLEGIEEQAYQSVSGAPDCGYSLNIEFDPSMTSEIYQQKLSEYLEQFKLDKASR